MRYLTLITFLLFFSCKNGNLQKIEIENSLLKQSNDSLLKVIKSGLPNIKNSQFMLHTTSDNLFFTQGDTSHFNITFRPYFKTQLEPILYFSDSIINNDNNLWELAGKIDSIKIKNWKGQVKFPITKLGDQTIYFKTNFDKDKRESQSFLSVMKFTSLPGEFGNKWNDIVSKHLKTQ